MLLHLSDCFPFTFLTIAEQIAMARHTQRHTKPGVRHTQCGLPGRHQWRGQLVRFTASVLRCRWATFTSGTAVTLQHNGLLIEGRGNRRLSFHHNLGQE